jgi:hypothetical protein
MALKLSVLPAFNGADESSGFQTYSLCPDPDGHSVWALMLYWGSLPDNTPSGPDVQYNIVKIDLNTKQITKKWNYDTGSMPLGCVEGSCFFFLDSDGMIWTARGPAAGALQQNDPNSGFALVSSFGQSTIATDPEFIDSLNSHGSPSWVNWTVGGIKYMAYIAQHSSWETMIVVCNLTTGHVIGNFWTFEGFGSTYSNPAFAAANHLALGDIFVDASGNLWWVMEEVNSGGVIGASDNAWFFKWSPADGTVAQPIRTVQLADPFLNNVSWTIVPSARYNSVGTAISNGTDLRAHYIPAKNYVALGKAQNAGGRSGFGGDISILDMNGLTFSQVAFIPSADPAAMIYAPDSGEDIGAYLWQDNSKRQGISNANIIVSSSGAAGGTDAVGRASLLSSSDLSTLKSYDLNAAVLAADPLYVAGFHWCYSWPFDNQLSGGEYIAGDMVTTVSGDHLFIAKNTIAYPTATNPAADPTNWTDLAPGSPFPGGSGLIYRGVYDATVAYSKNDVVVREDYVGDVTGRPFTATADSTGVDPIVSGSDFWFPATNTPWYPWLQPTFPNTRASCGGVLAHMLYYETAERIVWTYDFLGSPLYMLSPDVLPPPPNVPGPPGGTSFIPKPQPAPGLIQNIPLNNLPNQTWDVAVRVNGQPVTLQIVLRYNEIARYWIATVRDQDGNLLIDSLPFITGTGISQNLLGQFAYLAIGSAAIFNASGTPVDHPNNQDLGKDFLLLWGEN